MIEYNSALSEQERFVVSAPTEDDPTETKFVTYEDFVTTLVKELGSRSQNLIHMLMGITGEAGELMDAVKKHTIYNKPLDEQNVIEELGDLEFYMAGLRQILGISRFETLSANVTKLGKRYANGYSDAAAIARADKS